MIDAPEVLKFRFSLHMVTPPQILKFRFSVHIVKDDSPSLTAQDLTRNFKVWI